jgi:hypothetical protein
VGNRTPHKTERNGIVRTGGIGGSLFLIALGAILFWAVQVEAEGFSINTAGLILMIIGGLGLILSLLLTESVEKDRHRDDGVTIVER